MFAGAASYSLGWKRASVCLSVGNEPKSIWKDQNHAGLREGKETWARMHRKIGIEQGH